MKRVSSSGTPGVSVDRSVSTVCGRLKARTVIYSRLNSVLRGNDENGFPDQKDTPVYVDLLCGKPHRVFFNGKKTAGV